QQFAPCPLSHLDCQSFPPRRSSDLVLVNGKRPAGEVMYSFNKTKDGWLVALYNHRGIDKTQNGIARVDRSQFVEVALETKLNVTDRKSTRLNSSHQISSYAVFCLRK